MINRSGRLLMVLILFMVVSSPTWAEATKLGTAPSSSGGAVEAFKLEDEDHLYLGLGFFNGSRRTLLLLKPGDWDKLRGFLVNGMDLLENLDSEKGDGAGLELATQDPIKFSHGQLYLAVRGPDHPGSPDGSAHLEIIGVNQELGGSVVVRFDGRDLPSLSRLILKIDSALR